MENLNLSVTQTIKIMMLRHAETEWNRSGRFQGRTDVKLDSQTEERLKGLSEQIVPTSAKLFSSPLTRCLQTANNLFPFGSPKISDDLIERHYGDLEGVSMDDLDALNKSNYVPHAERTWSWQPKGGESNSDILARVLEFVKNLDDDATLVTHTGPIQCLLAHVRGGAPVFPPIKHETLYLFEKKSEHTLLYLGEKPVTQL